MSEFACCFVDSYISKGERLVIADISTMRVVAQARPANNRPPLGFAIDHRDGKVVLIANWEQTGSARNIETSTDSSLRRAKIDPWP